MTEGRTDISGISLELPAAAAREGAAAKVLLHSCCAPCSGAIIECMLAGGIRPVVFFSNSNIFPKEEYDLRLAEIRRYAGGLGLTVIEDEYDHDAWLERIKGLENEPERGARCLECFKFRLERAARYASQQGIPVLTTTLASSRWKDLSQVAAAGRHACSFPNVGSTFGAPDFPTPSVPLPGGRFEPTAVGPTVTFWDQNWRKGGLQPRRNEIIREQNFYNQNFCGCEFSKKEIEK